MKILVLGGTKFVGRHIVDALLSEGHDVTLFSRGQTGAELFPDLPKISGDRLSDVSGLKGTRWDAVVDVSAYVPRAVDSVARALADPKVLYLFISTISVYDNPPPAADEDSDLCWLEDPSVEEITGDTYGGLKVLCEQRVHHHFPNSIIVRPGLIVGPYDPTDRFTYWVWRFSKGGQIPVPNRKNQPVQVIDARDLAAFVAKLVSEKSYGTFNAVGESTTFGDMIELVQQKTSSEVVWMPPRRFEEVGVKTWANLPLVLPYDGSGDGTLQVSDARARAAGLTRRDLRTTIADTRLWCQDMQDMKVGMTDDMERALLDDL